MALSSAGEEFTVLFVQGAWHTPAFYQPIIAQLQAQGLPAFCPHLPTCDASMLERDPEMDMSADARVVERDLQHLIVSEKRRVLLVLHSYGGVPGMEAALKEYGLRDRLAANNAGGIIGILCISAFLVLPNTSLEDLNGGNPAPFVIVHSDGSTTTRDPALHFFHDLDPKVRNEWAAKLVAQPRKAHSSNLNHAGYQHMPTGYVLCENDQASPLFVQEMMVKTIRDSGVDILEYRCNAGHSPQLSQPETVINFMRDFVKAVEGGHS